MTQPSSVESLVNNKHSIQDLLCSQLLAVNKGCAVGRKTCWDDARDIESLESCVGVSEEQKYR